jgi:hypothetical protein
MGALPFGGSGGTIAAVAALTVGRVLAQPAAPAAQDSATFDPDGTAHVVRVVPMPDLISPEAQQWIASLAHYQSGVETLAQRRARTDDWRARDSAEALKHYPVAISESEIAGVRIDRITPLQMPAVNRHRVFINLHGGGFKSDSGSLLAAGAAGSAPVRLSSEQDHQRLMALLHIAALRSGPDGDPTSPHAANFDESKVAAYPPLPDPLVLKNGERVTTSDVWWHRRRAQIVEDFDREVYGRVPHNIPRVLWQVTRATRETDGTVPVLTKQIIGHLDNASYPFIDVDIQLSLTTPLDAHGPVPVIMEFALSPGAIATPRSRLTAAQWDSLAGPGPSWQSQVLARGWGYATLMPTSVQADDGAGLTQGVIGLANQGQPRKLEDWGALRAWAWAASRALDYFETDRAVDATQVGIEGLSRYGKAALVAMAYEPRLAIAFVGSSGEAGAKIMRRDFGEQVENVASTAEYHWMAGNFLKYAGPLTANDLPVDSHELIAMCAPRPVFISSGSPQVEGGWVDAKGMFLGAVGAGPVYRLLGRKDLGTSLFPPMETALIDGDLAFRQHRGGHSTGPNWPTFLTFASRYLRTPI